MTKDKDKHNDKDNEGDKDQDNDKIHKLRELLRGENQNLLLWHVIGLVVGVGKLETENSRNNKKKLKCLEDPRKSKKM